MRIELGQIGPRATQRQHVVDIKPYQARPTGPECEPMTGIPKGPEDMGPDDMGLVDTGRGRVKRQPFSYHP